MQKADLRRSDLRGAILYGTNLERVPVFVEVEVAVPHLSPAEW
jgi:hypothetical protein